MRSGAVKAVLMLLWCAASNAQTDLSGMWENKRQHENSTEEVEPGDYAGIPLTQAARLRADTWHSSLLTLPEHQCAPHGADRIDNFTNLRIWQEIDLETQQLVAIHMNVEWMNPHRVIYMDGRVRLSSYAEHTYMGFSTGAWEGDTLVVTTTHLKASWLKRNGVPRSDQATSIERFIRHGDYLMQVTETHDPVYLTEPMFRSVTYKLEPTLPPFAPYPCETAEEVVREEGVVPHYLPGTNDQLPDWRSKYGIPEEAANGGPATIYPEYIETLKRLMALPGATPR